MKHRWVKLRVHHYICRTCGCGRVNFQASKNEWATKYCRPSGITEVLRHTPPCEVGPKTDQYLQHYAAEIATFLEAKAATRAAKRALAGGEAIGTRQPGVSSEPDTRQVDGSPATESVPA